MSREIKFRAWDKDLYKYVTGAEFGLARMSIKPDEDNERIFSFDTLFLGRYTWEQYTGLTDKYGVEIYEGDLLRCIGTYGDYFYRQVVWAGDGWFLLEYLTDSLTINGNDDSGRLGYYSESAREVIGNIHEGSEPLEVKNE